MKTKSMFVYSDFIADVCLRALRESNQIIINVEHAYDVYTTGVRILEVTDRNNTVYKITVEAL